MHTGDESERCRAKVYEIDRMKVAWGEDRAETCCWRATVLVVGRRGRWGGGGPNERKHVRAQCKSLMVLMLSDNIFYGFYSLLCRLLDLSHTLARHSMPNFQQRQSRLFSMGTWLVTIATWNALCIIIMMMMCVRCVCALHMAHSIQK